MQATSSDGTTLIGGDSAGETLTASASGNDTLIGGTSNDTFVAGLGNDTMTGGGGNDVYDFTHASPSGNYVINDYHTDGGSSVINLASGVAAADVTASRSGDDLVLTIGGDPITVQNYFADRRSAERFHHRHQ